MEEKHVRQSNIELLRILAICGVIILHYNSSANGGFSSVDNGSINQFILVFLESIAICVVNVFVIISGYFLCKNNTRDFLKPLGLIAQVIFFALIGFAIGKIALPSDTNIDTVFSYLFSTNWFVYVFAALYLISPFINVMWDRLNESARRVLLVFLIALFSVYPTIIDIVKYWSGRTLNGSSTIGIEGSQAGYTIVNFVILYIIGASIRSNPVRHMDKGKNKSAFFICLCLNTAWAYADGIREGKNIYDTVAWNYSNPLVIAQAAFLFMIFKDLKVKHSRLINALAAASFTVYILHFRFLDYLKINEFVTKNSAIMVLHLFLCIIGLYLVCTVCYYIYSLIAVPVSKSVSKKMGELRKFSI